MKCLTSQFQDGRKVWIRCTTPAVQRLTRNNMDYHSRERRAVASSTARVGNRIQFARLILRIYLWFDRFDPLPQIGHCFSLALWQVTKFSSSVAQFSAKICRIFLDFTSFSLLFRSFISYFNQLRRTMPNPTISMCLEPLLNTAAPNADQLA